MESEPQFGARVVRLLSINSADLHGFQLAQQGAGGFWNVGGQVLMTCF